MVLWKTKTNAIFNSYGLAKQMDHVNVCYFCLTNVRGNSKKTAHLIQYPDLPSAVLPRPYEPGEEPPVPPKDLNIPSDSDDEVSETPDDMEADWRPDDEEHTCKTINQDQLDSFVRKLGLSKDGSYLAATMLKQFGVLAAGTNTTAYRARDKMFVKFFKTSDGDEMVYCDDIEGLLSRMNIHTNVKEDWWLFVDGSVNSTKAVLLHKDNMFPALPVAYSRKVKESYSSMKLIFELIHYDNFKWRVCSDLKVIGMLTGMQGGYTKYNCFICLWDSRARQQHYSRNNWPDRVNRTPGVQNVLHEALVPPGKVILPPLHIKLGIFKNFVKALDSEGEPMKTLKNIFSRLSAAKIKEGVFVGQDTRKLMKSQQFQDALSPVELRAWNAIKKCVENFLGMFSYFNHLNNIRTITLNGICYLFLFFSQVNIDLLITDI